ncbi:MAG: hypothetical protein ACI9KK_000589 [Ascidiaceihabitans sp.]|jgi:hypothetical protein
MTQKPPMTDKPKRGVLLRAQNGDVIGFDETGVRLNLADSVIADIQTRLDLTSDARVVDASVLGDINAWDVREGEGWYMFHAHLPGAQNVGHFRRRIKAVGDSFPCIIANPSTALYGLLSLGGARRATTSDEPVEFPYHVLSTGDDMGSAGPAGSQVVEQTDLIERLNEQTRDSLVGDEIVGRRLSEYRALPVMYVRSETDSSSSILSLADGPAMANFRQTTANFCAAAATLGVAPKVLAVGLDFTLEAVADTGDVWRRGMYSIMQTITDLFADHGLRKPLFIAPFESGTQNVSDHPVMRAQWDLSWNKGGHDIFYSAPSYMFELDHFGRATPLARKQMAEMDAFAIESCNNDEDWSCPVLLLAEREEDPRVIRCRAQSMNALIIDRDDPLNAGPTCGFAFEGCTNDAKILDVDAASDDQNDLLITCDIAPEGDGLTLLYAVAHAASSDGMPANRGAIRDEWHHASKTGDTLYRWALPAALPVH